MDEFETHNFLQYVFDQVNDWLKYAEMKNASIFVAGTGGLVGTILLYPSFINHSVYSVAWWFSVFFWDAVFFFVISTLFSLISILPNINFQWVLGQQKPSEEDNLYFFGHIANYDPKSYVKQIEQKYDLKHKGENAWNYDLAAQIITNARITVRKFRLYKFSAWSLICGLLTPIGALVIWILVGRNNDS